MSYCYSSRWDAGTPPAPSTSLTYRAHLEGKGNDNFEITEVSFTAHQVDETTSTYQVVCEIGYRNTGDPKVFQISETQNFTPEGKDLGEHVIAGVPLLAHRDSRIHLARSVPFLTKNQNGPLFGRGVSGEMILRLYGRFENRGRPCPDIFL